MSVKNSIKSDKASSGGAPDSNGVKKRLIRCFRAVFGQLTPEELMHASADSVEGWDSVATVTLAALVEEEFGVQLEPSELEQLTSFECILRILEKRGHA